MSGSSQPPHTPPRVLFPQTCTFDTHYMNHKGDLYTALITGGNRLLLLKNGVVLAQSGPLFDDAAAATSSTAAATTTTTAAAAPATTSSRTGAGTPSPAPPPQPARVCAVSVCRFTDDVVRVAVATTTEVLLYEFDDAGQLWRDTRAAAFWRTAEDSGGGVDTTAAAAAPLPSAAAASRYLAVHGRLGRSQGSATGAARPSESNGHHGTRGAPSMAPRSGGAVGRLRWRRIGVELFGITTAAAPASASARGGALSAATVAAAVVVPVRLSAPSRPSVVRAMDFVSEDTLCLVLGAEAVLIVLGNGSGGGSVGAAAGQLLVDRVVWRSMGAYRSLAVCRVNHHVALVLGHATMVVFPSRVVSADGQALMSSPASPSVVDGRRFAATASSTAASSFFNANPISSTAAAAVLGGLHANAMLGTGESRSSSVVPTPAFSPTSHPPLASGFPSAPGRTPAAAAAVDAPGPEAYMTLAERGLTTSVGIYHITDVRWHRVSTHTLLCVTCTHPQEETAYLMLYTVQSLSSTRRYTNVMEEHADGGWGLCRGGYDGDGAAGSSSGASALGRGADNIVQLVPAGVIALAYTPSAVPHAATSVGRSGGSTAAPGSTTDTSQHRRFLPGTPDAAASLSTSAATGTVWGDVPPPSVADMHTGLVPNFSRSAEANSLTSRMEFVHVEGDGTVRTSSYAFGRQKHASFAKQRAVGLACTALLQPLLRLYGALATVTVLPTWRTRPIELGHDTGTQPCAVEVMLSASRRYRMVLRFTSGVVLAVMVDLSAAVYRVECFLTLGAAPLLSLRAVAPLSDAAAAGVGAAGSSSVLLAGLLGWPAPTSPPPRSRTASVEAAAAGPAQSVWGAVLLQVEPSGMQARVLTVAPLSTVRLPSADDAVDGGGDDGGGGGGGGDGGAPPVPEQVAAPAVVTEDDVVAFMVRKCPDKLRFMAALLKAAQQDAGRLMTQLIAKYGPLEKDDAAVAVPAPATGSAAVAAPTASTTPALSRSPDALVSGCIGAGGEVLLLVRASAAYGDVDCAAALVRLRPPCLEELAPVHRLVAAGVGHIPFVPAAAEYVPLPVALQRLWRAPTPSGPQEQFASDVQAAVAACERHAAAVSAADAVQCELVRVAATAVEGGSTSVIRVRSPLSPATSLEGTAAQLHCLPLPASIDPRSVVRVAGALLVNHDVVVGVLCRGAQDDAGTAVLHLYGCPAVQSLAAPAAPPTSPASAFALEATLTAVAAFYLSSSGEVVVLRTPARTPPRFERWLRCFPSRTTDPADGGGGTGAVQGNDSFVYVQDSLWCPPCGTGHADAAATTVTALVTVDVAGAWEANVGGVSAAGHSRGATRPVIYATSHHTFLHVRQLPLRGGRRHCGAAGGAPDDAALPQYHPDSIMQLIGMARWAVLARVLRCVAEAARAVVVDTTDGSTASLVAPPPEEVARRLCTSAVARGFHDRPQVVPYEDVVRRVTPPLVSIAALREEDEEAGEGETAASSPSPLLSSAGARLHDLSATCGPLVHELTGLLPQVTLSGLKSTEQLKLLCILQALHDALPLSRGIDEAAARYLFYSRYMSLGRRLRLANADVPVAAAAASVPVSSVLHFEVGSTATRTVTTAAFVWAAMSDSQSTLVSLLFDRASTVFVDGGGSSGSGGSGVTHDLTWEQVEQSGVAFWLRAAADLRAMADRMARQQYHATKELPACALMYCAARKVGTLAALAKAQNNMRLHAFFSRDFAGDEHHRAAAAANAYAAISKNMPQYGAAFFLLAGDVRSAVQVLLQRCRSPSLALFVLRAAGDGVEDLPPQSQTLLEWYVTQRAAEAATCGALDMWEQTCLSWIDGGAPRSSAELAVQRRLRALEVIASHPTAHPEALCALRYARDSVAALAHRGHRFLSTPREVVCLLRLGRYCVAHRLRLNAYLHYRDAGVLLRRLRAEAAAVRAGALVGALRGDGVPRSGAPTPAAKMAADFNTGTLVFRGFGSDSDDGDEPGDDPVTGRAPRTNGAVAAVTAAAPADGLAVSFVLSDEAAAAAEAEVRYAYTVTGAARRPAREDSRHGAVRAGAYEDLLRRLLLSFTTASAFMITSSVAAAAAVAVPSLGDTASTSASPDEAAGVAGSPEPFHVLLTSLLRLLARESEHRQRGTNRAATVPSSCSGVSSASDGGWHALCVPLLHLLLGKAALLNANYVVLLALQQVPVSTEGVLAEAAADDDSSSSSGDGDGSGAPASSPLHRPLAAFFRLLEHHVRLRYRDACDANGVPRADAVEDNVGNCRDDDDDDSDDGRVHRNMFDAVLAAATAAEEASDRAGRVREAAPCAAGVSWSRRLAQTVATEAGVTDAAPPLRLTPSAQVSLLLSCCQAQLQLRLMEHLRQLARDDLDAGTITPTTRRAMDAGILYADALSPEAEAAVLQRRLVLSALLLDVTAQWTALSEECMMRLYVAQPQHAPGPLTDPNGTFLEAQQLVKLMRAVVVAAVLDTPLATPSHAVGFLTTAEPATAAPHVGAPDQASPPSPSSPRPRRSSTTWLQDNSLTLVELCMAQLELFWTLPAPILTQCPQLAAPTQAALGLLSESAASHASARALLERMVRPVEVAAADSLAERCGADRGARTPSPPPSLLTTLAAAITPASSPLRSWGESPTASPRRGWPDGPRRPESRAETYCPALSYMHLAWMRRHHTHALLRWLLLVVTLDRGAASQSGLLNTDRLILTHHSHSVTGVRFDASSCDSVVWTTEAGTSVGHGFRELLAGDNEEALATQATERNLATAAFTLGLAAQQDRLRLATHHAEQPHTPVVVAAVAAKAVLESRPRCGVAANAAPSSHPHLPFYLLRHRDGHLDLYPFASQECVASFCCALRHGQGSPTSATASGGDGGDADKSASAWLAWTPAAVAPLVHGRGLPPPSSPGVGAAGGVSTRRVERYAVTPVAFSPNGYSIAVGLSDGSIVGWRFAAAAVESPPAFHFPQLFTAFGVRACTFCGDRSSLLVAVGVAREPHGLHGTGAAASCRADARTAAAASPTVSSTASRQASTQLDAGEMVGEVLVLDTMLDTGAVTARCALPFTPTYAVFLTSLRAVLVVSVEGKLATYAVATGRLAVLGTVPVAAVLRSTLGPTMGAAAGAASAVRDSGAVHITCVARSAYDPLVALGTSNGLVLLLHMRHISAAMARAERRIREDGADVFVYYPPTASAGYEGVTAGGGSRRDGSKRPAAPQLTRGDAVSSPTSAAARMATEVAAPAMGDDYMDRLPEETVLSEATCVQVAPHVHPRCAVEDVTFSPSMLLAGLRDGTVMAASLISHATRACLTAGCAVATSLLECS
ncbi:RAVE protein 1 C terminal [Novymonas esmeraldas]|uniref:RAVE protein 1 C terminal n=1 Tax=Novymonas esmeraldas TaxID=1808958 RepID=A0AAW0EKA5_9TRYP